MKRFLLSILYIIFAIYVIGTCWLISFFVDRSIPLSLGEFLLFAGGLIIGIGGIYFAHRQTHVLERQSKIQSNSLLPIVAMRAPRKGALIEKNAEIMIEFENIGGGPALGVEAVIDGGVVPLGDLAPGTGLVPFVRITDIKTEKMNITIQYKDVSGQVMSSKYVLARNKSMEWKAVSQKFNLN